MYGLWVQHVQLVEVGQLFLQKCYLLIDLWNSVFENLILLVYLGQLLVKFVRVLLVLVYLRDQFLCVRDEGVHARLHDFLLQLWDDDLLNQFLLLSLFRVIVLHLVVHLPRVLSLYYSHISNTRLFVAHLPVNLLQLRHGIKIIHLILLILHFLRQFLQSVGSLPLWHFLLQQVSWYLLPLILLGGWLLWLVRDS